MWEMVCGANPLRRKMRKLSEEVNAHEFMGEGYGCHLIWEGKTQQNK
jgi:hypothetical protein